MTGPAAPPGASNKSTAYPYWYGPWLVAYGEGPRAEACAVRVRDECTRRGFDGPRLELAAAAREHLDRYPGLVLVASADSTPGEDRMKVLQPAEDLVLGYRARRRAGLAELLRGAVATYNAGILQVIGPRELFVDPASSRLMERVCAHHELDGLDPAQLFSIFDRSVPGLAVPSGYGLMNPELTVLWEELERWGVTNTEQVPLLLERIDVMREYFENDHLAALHRPIAGVALNMLDFVLDQPDRREELPTWTADRARVVRKVIEQLQEIVPTIQNPARTRGSTRRFSMFYQNLLAVSEHIEPSTPAS